MATASTTREIGVAAAAVRGAVKLAVYTMNRLTAVTNHLRTAALPTEVANAPVGAGGYEDEYRIPGALPAPPSSSGRAPA